MSAKETAKSFLAGWAGGVGNLLVGHPFDTVKVRMQNAPPGMYTGAVDCLRQSIKAEGMGTIYKGVTAPMSGVGLVFAIYFVTFDSAERALRTARGYDGQYKLGLHELMFCGGTTGVVGTLILGPAELLKVQQQTAMQRGDNGSLSAVVGHIYRTQGMRGFLRGFGATLMRDVPGSMAWFGAYELTKQKICEDPKKPTTFQALFAGGMGGLGMWTTAMPMDAIKTRIQANKGAKIGYASAARQIYTEAGVAGFYRGFAPIMLRAFPANAATFAFKEYAQSGLDLVW